MFIKASIIILIMLIIPVVIGYMVNKILKIDSAIVANYVSGMIAMFSVFQIIAVPMILLKKMFSTLVMLWCIIIFIMSMLSLILFIYNIAKGNSFRNKAKTHARKNVIVYIFVLIVMCLIVGFQCYMYNQYQHYDEDDSRFIVNAVEAYDNNTMIVNNPATGEIDGNFSGELAKDVTAPWMIYIALLSKLVSIYPTIFAHTILPVFLVVFTYCIYWLIGSTVFKNDKISSSLFVIIGSTLNIFGYSTVYTDSAFLLARIWQGKALLAGAIIPLFIYILLKIYSSNKEFGYSFLLLLSTLSACMLSGMGVYLSGIIVFCYSTIYLICKENKKSVLLMLPSYIPPIIYGLLYFIISR